MSKKKVRIVISENSLQEAFEAAQRWVENLKKDVQEERRTTRTRGLILLGAALLGDMPDEGKVSIYEEIIGIDNLLKNPKTSPDEKKSLKNRAAKIAVALARKQHERLKQESPVGKNGKDASSQDGE